MRTKSLTVLAAVAGMVCAATASADRKLPVPAERPGRQFFADHVLPKLAENGCGMCHAVGYLQPNVLIYDQLLPYLAMGTTPEMTPVIRKIANLRAIRTDLPTHPGGQRCETLASEPCKSIIEWWQVEFGNSANGSQK